MKDVTIGFVLIAEKYVFHVIMIKNYSAMVVLQNVKIVRQLIVMNVLKLAQIVIQQFVIIYHVLILVNSAQSHYAKNVKL